MAFTNDAVAKTPAVSLKRPHLCEETEIVWFQLQLSPGFPQHSRAQFRFPSKSGGNKYPSSVQL